MHKDAARHAYIFLLQEGNSGTSHWTEFGEKSPDPNRWCGQVEHHGRARRIGPERAAALAELHGDKFARSGFITRTSS